MSSLIQNDGGNIAAASAVGELLNHLHHQLHDDSCYSAMNNSNRSRRKDGGVSTSSSSSSSGIPAVDILDTPKDYVFYVDVPGLSKSDIQVTVEDDTALVIRSSGKRKRGDQDQDTENKEASSSCKYIRLERRVSPFKFVRKFRLPDNSNISAISAKCENGVLTVTVEKLPPPPKPRAVQVTVS